MAHAYLADFRQRVRNAHDHSGLTCHWTKTDELTSALLYRDSKGPCNCPTPPVSAACLQHSQFNCANTATVLGMATGAEAHYAPMLEKLGNAMSEIEDTIRSAEEAIRNLMTGGLNRGAAMDDSVITSIMRGHAAPNRPYIHDILENLQLDRLPSIDLAPPSCHCECWENKNYRLEAEKKLIETLIEQVRDQSAEVLKAWNDGQASFSNTLGPVLKGSIQIVTGVASGQAVPIISGLGDLLQYYKDGQEDGRQLYILYKAIAEVGELKRLAMLGVIYHDQQLTAPTCVVDETSSTVERPRIPTTEHPLTMERPPQPKPPIRPPRQPTGGGMTVTGQGNNTVVKKPDGTIVVVTPRGTTVVMRPDCGVMVIPPTGGSDPGRAAVPSRQMGEDCYVWVWAKDIRVVPPDRGGGRYRVRWRLGFATSGDVSSYVPVGGRFFGGYFGPEDQAILIRGTRFEGYCGAQFQFEVQLEAHGTDTEGSMRSWQGSGTTGPISINCPDIEIHQLVIDFDDFAIHVDISIQLDCSD